MAYIARPQGERDFLLQQRLLAQIARAGGFVPYAVGLSNLPLSPGKKLRYAEAAGLDPYSVGLSNLAIAFKPKGGFAPAMACMDGGMKRTTIADPRPSKVRLAAPLLHEEPAKALDRTVEIMRETGANLVSYHAGCGAGEILAKRTGGGNGGLVVQQFAMAAAGGVPDAMAVESPLDRPEYHSEVVIYLASVPFAPWLVVDKAGVPQLPEGFVLSAWAMTDVELQVQVETAIGIAFGLHGGGHLFTEERPLYLISVASSLTKFGRLDRLANQFADKANAKYGDKVWVDSFVWEGETS